VNNNDLINEIEQQRNQMLAVATGGPRIDSVNGEYRERRAAINSALSERGIENPNPYGDLWDFYGKWSSGDLPTYQSRRTFLRDLFDPLIEQLRHPHTRTSAALYPGPTGWARIDRDIGEMRNMLEEANSSVQFQAVGLFCRETLISLAQEVYDPEIHLPEDGISPSRTDAKRMLDGFVRIELSGGANERTRKHAKASFDLANELQHQRTANFRQAAMCAEATTAVVNLIAIVSGRRDPEDEN